MTAPPHGLSTRSTFPLQAQGQKNALMRSRYATGSSRTNHNTFTSSARRQCRIGRAVGAIEAVLACCEIPMTVIERSAWKKLHRLRGKDKEGGRQRALQLFPAQHALLALKRWHGRAESALIALYGALQ